MKASCSGGCSRVCTGLVTRNRSRVRGPGAQLWCRWTDQGPQGRECVPEDPQRLHKNRLRKVFQALAGEGPRSLFVISDRWKGHDTLFAITFETTWKRVL